MMPPNRVVNSHNEPSPKQNTPTANDDQDGGPEAETLASVLFFVGNGTAHGLPQVVAGKSLWRKIVWALIFIGAMGYFCFFLHKIIITYLKHCDG